MADETLEQIDEVEEPRRRAAARELDEQERARRAAALAQVRQFGDPVLTTPTRPVERFDEALREEVARMERIMDGALGQGIAAPQLGSLQRLLIYRFGDAPISVLANPVLEWASREKEVFEEGCLSIQNVTVDVERPIHVRVRAQDERGAEIVVEASGIEARVIQHEMDHLDGVLMLDRAPRDQRRQALRALREAARANAAA